MIADATRVRTHDRPTLQRLENASDGWARDRFQLPPSAPDRRRSEYIVNVSDEIEDSTWDGFLETSPRGEHVQTSLWAQVKARQGWRATRVVVKNGSRIVAGAQLLVRHVRGLGDVAYVAKGPVFHRDDPALVELVMRTLHQIVDDRSIQVLFLQPTSDGARFADQLPNWGFRPSPISTSPTATSLVNLSGDLDTILSGMKKNVRKSIRRSQREGITVRDGTRDDLPVFHRLLAATAERRGFSPFSLGYFDQMWSILEPRGYIKLLVSEYEQETVSAQLMVAFRDTVFAKQYGWSGRHGRRQPNEALDWATIQWAKSRGYDYYDLEGIDPRIARAHLNGEPLSESSLNTPSAYKLRFGSEVRLYPQTYCYIANSFARAAYNRVGHRLSRLRFVRKAVGRFRTA